MKAKRLFALLLAVCIILSVGACGRTGGAYTIVEVLEEGNYAIGFRNNDPTADYVEAALKVLAARGKVAELETKWFNDNVIRIDKDAGALEKLGNIPQRSFIMGLDPDNFPMSYVSNGVYMGFDVELCRAVCDLLGWELKFAEVEDEGKAYVHLISGNVDAVWGGMLLNPNEKDYSVRCPYMKGGSVIVVLAGSGLNSLRKLGDKCIGMNDAPRYAQALQGTGLSSTAQVVVMSEGSEVLFDSLYSGTYDAIVTDYAAAQYYMR